MAVGLNFVAEIEARALSEGWLENPAYRAGEQIVSYEELFRISSEVGAAYLRHGVSPGDRICIVLPETIDLVTAFLGALRIGAIAVPINGSSEEDVLVSAVRRADASLVVRHREFDVPDGCAAVSLAELRGSVAGDSDIAEVTAEGPAFTVFTSGTTGPAKLCTHTHGDIYHFNDGVGADESGSAVSELVFAAGGVDDDSGWQALTETERAIAELVGAGLTNRQTAKRMYLSPHTVNYHLRSIFRKLGVSSRIELARYWYRNGA